MSGGFGLAIQSIVRWDYCLAFVLTTVSVWGFYKLALADLSRERHRLFATQFKALWTRGALFLAMFLLYKGLFFFHEKNTPFDGVLLYAGTLAVILGAICLTKLFKIIAFEYFFFSSKKAGVPLLLVNVGTLLLSLVIMGWALTSLFGVHLSSVLATSAVLSIVLGLALQDTLGNLFAAISLQIDKPFEMDDWIEIRNGSDKIAGQVKELSWRAIVLLAISEEFITIPNRSLAQSQIVNFSARHRPFYRGHFFRIPFDASIEQAKQALFEAMADIPGILPAPDHMVLLIETTESWVTLKAIYTIESYGTQFVIADKFQQKALECLAARGITLAGPRMRLDGLQDLAKLTDRTV